MQIDYVVCPEIIEEKLAKKHHVTMREVRQALLNNPRIRFAEKGYMDGEDVFAAFSQTLVSPQLNVVVWGGHQKHPLIYANLRE